MRFLWMSLECFRVFFAFICFCSMIESAAHEYVVVVAMKNLFCDDIHMRCFFSQLLCSYCIEMVLPTYYYDYDYDDGDDDHFNDDDDDDFDDDLNYDHMIMIMMMMMKIIIIFSYYY